MERTNGFANNATNQLIDVPLAQVLVGQSYFFDRITGLTGFLLAENPVNPVILSKNRSNLYLHEV